MTALSAGAAQLRDEIAVQVDRDLNKAGYMAVPPAAIIARATVPTVGLSFIAVGPQITVQEYKVLLGKSQQLTMPTTQQVQLTREGRVAAYRLLCTPEFGVYRLLVLLNSRLLAWFRREMLAAMLAPTEFARRGELIYGDGQIVATVDSAPLSWEKINTTLALIAADDAVSLPHAVSGNADEDPEAVQAKLPKNYEQLRAVIHTKLFTDLSQTGMEVLALLAKIFRDDNNERPPRHGPRKKG